MTAAQVHGVEVIADQPAPTNISHRDGTPVLYRQIRLLLLEDGTETYGCLHCDYTGTVNQVRPHLNAHRGVKTPKPDMPSPGSAQVAGLDVGELIRRLKAHEALAQDRDRWKARALDAERDLTDLRRIYQRTAARHERSH